MEQISTILLDEIEEYLRGRVNVDVDGLPNQAFHILIQLQAERDNQENRDDHSTT